MSVGKVVFIFVCKVFVAYVVKVVFGSFVKVFLTN